MNNQKAFGIRNTFQNQNTHTANKLLYIRLLHTIVWAFFALAILFVIYSGIINKISIYTWTSIVLVILEGLVLLIFKNQCPITIIARKYSNSTKENFDIFLPNWLAKYNKQIFTPLFIAACVLVLVRSMF